MNVFLIIILTILVTAIASLEFKPEHNKAAIKELGTTGKRAKAMAKFIEIYPGFELFANLISLLAMIWIACLCALTWGMWAGCFIALVVIALAQLLGARLVSLTDQFIIRWAGFLVQYFGWTGIFSSLVVSRHADPVGDVDELINVLHASRIDCPTQLLVEKALHLRNLPIEKLVTKWSDVQKVNYKEKLTPKTIDELFQLSATTITMLSACCTLWIFLPLAKPRKVYSAVCTAISPPANMTQPCRQYCS